MHPIPDAALDDRLGIVGTAGSGKTYGAGTAVERILARKGRCIIPDPLGVWWGLRARPDGVSPSPFDVVIFGGEHGDLPLNEHAGALIGETVAGMKESAILDLSELGTKAAERRFMLAFLTALYRKASGEPVHLIFDEADMWAPQKLLDKDGEAAKLLGMMETICRRGRVKGFIPWLITQRPAVVNKDVLSQVDGLVAFKLTSSQDRDALAAWVEGQADKKDWNRIYAALATKDRGNALVWLPARGVLADHVFPEKHTFDSSRTPKRGEKRQSAQLKPLDVSALKVKLVRVEEEAKANDPRALRAEIASLRRQMQQASAAASKAGNVPDPKAIEEAEQRGYEQGFDKALKAVADLTGSLAEALARAETAAGDGKRLLSSFSGFVETQAAARPKFVPVPVARKSNGVHQPAPRSLAAAQSRPRDAAPTDVNPRHMKIIEALAFWQSLGFGMPSREQVGIAAGYAPSSGNFNNLLGNLRTMALVDYPAGGRVALTPAGAAIAPEPAAMPVRDRLRAVLSPRHEKIVDALMSGETLSRDELGERSGYQASSGNFNNLVGNLRTLGVIDYPSKGYVAIQPWVL